MCKDFDYLELQDGRNNLLTRWCGSRPPEALTLSFSGGELKVIFHSDKSLTYKGFRLRYEKSGELCWCRALSSNCCCRFPSFAFTPMINFEFPLQPY